MQSVVDTIGLIGFLTIPGFHVSLQRKVVLCITKKSIIFQVLSNQNCMLTFLIYYVLWVGASLIEGETGYLAEKTGGGWWKVALDSGSSTKQEVDMSLINMLQKCAVCLLAAHSYYRVTYLWRYYLTFPSDCES